MDFAALREEATHTPPVPPRGPSPAWRSFLAHHGVFAFDRTPARTLKAAVMVEDAAKTLWLARQLGSAEALPTDEIRTWWDRYHTRYGQE